MKRYFQISCHALIITAFLSLALTGRLDAPSIAIFTLGVAGSLYRTVKGMAPLVSTRAAFFLSCGYIALFVVDIAIISRSFIPATIHLVLFLELAKLYQDKTDKDYLYLIVLAFLKVLAASSLTIDMSFVATLWIILTGTVLFFIIPRVGTGYFSRAATPALLLSGFTESVQLGDIGQVKLSSAVVMHAKRVSGPAFDTLKWRGISLDRFDGVGWQKSDRRRVQIRPTGPSQFDVRPVEGTGEIVRYEVLLEPLATTTLFAPFQVRRVSGRLQSMDMDTDDSIYSRFQSLRRVQYEVLSGVPLKSRPAAMADAAINDPIPSAISNQYLQMPTDTDPQIRQLAQEITAPAATPLEKVHMVEAYLKRNYRYTLNLDWKPGIQPISTFLFSAKAGHCEYFASSMAVMLRTVGVPTRIVNGFLMGEYNPVGDAYIVRQSDAHSWVEVYIPGSGWTEFDPTPPDTNRPEFTVATQLAHYVDAMELFWNSYILVYDSGTQTQLFRSAQDRIQNAQGQLRVKSDSWMVQFQVFGDRIASRVRRWVETAWFWVLVCAVVLASTAWKHRKFLRAEWRIRRLRQGVGKVDGEVIEQMFYRVVRLADGKPDERPDAQTWREWTSGLKDPARRSLLNRALAVVERSRYGNQPPSSDDFQLMERTIRELRGT